MRGRNSRGTGQGLQWIEALERRALLSSAPDVAWNALGVNEARIHVEGGAITVNRNYQIHQASTGSFAIAYRLSVDSVWGNADDIILGGEAITAPVDRSPGAHAKVLTFTLAANTTVGDYRVLGMVDSGFVVAESNEANNVRFTEPKVSVTRIDAPWALGSLFRDTTNPLSYTQLENGFFRIDMAADWSLPAGTPINSRIIGQARETYTMTVGYRRLDERPADQARFLEALTKGADFILEHARDDQMGGFFWGFDHEGVIPPNTAANPYDYKNAIGHGYVAMTLAHVYQITGQTEYLEGAQEAWDILQTRLRLGHGFVWETKRDFSHTDRNPSIYRDVYPNLNTMMHVLEGGLALYEATPEGPARTALFNQIKDLGDFLTSTGTSAGTGLYRNQTGRTDRGYIAEYYDESSWTPISYSSGGRISLGHNIETAYFLSRAVEMGFPSDWLAPAENMLDYALAQGYDRTSASDGTRGILYQWTNYDGVLDSNQPKITWCQLETLRATMHWAVVRGRTDLWDEFNDTLAMARVHLIDPVNHGWVTIYDRFDAPKGRTDGWGTDYHDAMFFDELLRLSATEPLVAQVLGFGQQPSNATVGAALLPAVTVLVQDDGGNLVTNQTPVVTLAIASGPAGATLSGALSVQAVSGVAVFDELSLSLPGTYTLRAMADGLDAGVSTTFVVSEVGGAPTFANGANVTVLEDAGPSTLDAWATGISAGAAADPQAVLSFRVFAADPTLFASAPTINAAGDLSFTPRTNAFGSTLVTVTLEVAVDDEIFNSAPRLFRVTLLPVNDAPVITSANPPVVNEDSGPQVVARWATATTGAPNESTQTLTYQLSDLTNPSLFSVTPALGADGTLTYTPAPGLSGSASFTLTASDNGGVANNGVSSSSPQVFTITVIPFNDPPTLQALLVNQSSVIQGEALTATAQGASDPDNAINQIKLYIDSDGNGQLDPLIDSLLAIDVNVGDGVQWQVDTTSLPVGVAHLLAIAVDDDGGVSVPATASLSVIRIIPSQAGVASYYDANGTLVTARLAGPGSIEVVFDDPGTQVDPALLRVRGTTATSTLTITTLGNRATRMDDIEVGDPALPGDATAIRSITAKTTTLTGDLTVTGGLTSLTLAGADDAGLITIGSSADARATAAIALGRVVDTSLVSAMPLKSLVVTAWLDQDEAPDLITVPTIDALKAGAGAGSGGSDGGNFEAGLRLTGGADPRKPSLKSAVIAGAVGGGSWDVIGNVGNITAGSFDADFSLLVSGGITTVKAGGLAGGDFSGTLRAASLKSLFAGRVIDADIFTVGDIGAISAAFIIDSDIFAGVLDTTVWPSRIDDFAVGRAEIKSIIIRGPLGPVSAVPTFVRSRLAAAVLGRVTLKVVDTSDTGAESGVSAITIKSLTRTNAAPVRNLTTPGEYDRQGDWRLRIVGAE